MTNSDIENLIDVFTNLPGIGKRSAARFTLHILKNRHTQIANFIDALKQVGDNVKECNICGNLDSTSPCHICQDPKRSTSLLCIIENVEDLWAIERSNAFKGKYHILGGVLSAVKGIAPDDLNLNTLLRRIEEHEVTEVILATNPTLDGQTTALFITNIIKDKVEKISQLAHGIPLGSELDYIDEATLDAAFSARRPF